MPNKNQSLDQILRKVRKSSENCFEEKVLIQELLQIFYNRLNSCSTLCCPTFGSVFLRQSGLQFEDQLAIDEYNRYNEKKVIKYKPNVKIIALSLNVLSEELKSLWFRVDDSEDNILELVIITSIDGNRKQKQRLSYNKSNVETNYNLIIDKQFIHAFNEKSENIFISFSLIRYQKSCRKLFCNYCKVNQLFSGDINIGNLRGMPLTGLQSCVSSELNTKKGTKSLVKFEFKFKVEFTDDPKHLKIFKTVKHISHKRLLTKIYNRWPNESIPSQMKTIIEMSRQQNGVSNEEDLDFVQKVLTDIKAINEQNKRRNDFLNLINEAPIPVSNVDFNDNNGSNGSLPLVKDPKVMIVMKSRTKVRETAN